MIAKVLDDELDTIHAGTSTAQGYFVLIGQGTGKGLKVTVEEIELEDEDLV
jgi:hypothetical protein